jgi:hypothetical protein
MRQQGHRWAVAAEYGDGAGGMTRRRGCHRIAERRRSVVVERAARRGSGGTAASPGGGRGRWRRSAVVELTA